MSSPLWTSNHYCATTLHPLKLRAWADWAAQVVAAELNKNQWPLFCFQGLSGTTLATALGLAWNQLHPDRPHGMWYVRKVGTVTKGHWRPIVELLPSKATASRANAQLVFVDDFIESGETLEETLEVLQGAVGQTKGIINTTHTLAVLVHAPEARESWAHRQASISRSNIHVTAWAYKPGTGVDPTAFLREFIKGKLPPQTKQE